MACYNSEDTSSFIPLTLSLAEIRGAIPPRLFERKAHTGLYYLVRDACLALSFLKFASSIDSCFVDPRVVRALSPAGSFFVKELLWGAYWFFQSLSFVGIWAVGHECGHGAFSVFPRLNNAVGFIVHTILWTPYFSWKITHHRHHMNHGSIERDEVFVPNTRKDLHPDNDGDHHHDENRLDDLFGDTAPYMLLLLIRQQVLGWPAYLLMNASGQKHYPAWTNHFDPNSLLFTPGQRSAVLWSDAGILAMIFAISSAIRTLGAWVVFRYYGAPMIFFCNWVVMITYMQHTDAEVPHYRGKAWTFQRGAASTIDRPFLGWMGRFFMHDVAHFHVIHHFFPKMPFYHAEEATRYLRQVIGEHYRYSDKAPFRALWDTFNECQFVENEGDVVFYKNGAGQAKREDYNIRDLHA